ncbi:hypothetical protein CGUA_04830 [Corynebacterium guangdongense]|nr:hypothetical protein CGUA_04830 [Corynebacterium guangdongense]
MFCVCACPKCLDAKRNRDVNAHCVATPECMLADSAENAFDWDDIYAELRRRRHDLSPA